MEQNQIREEIPEQKNIKKRILLAIIIIVIIEFFYIELSVVHKYS